MRAGPVPPGSASRSRWLRRAVGLGDTDSGVGGAVTFAGDDHRPASRCRAGADLPGPRERPGGVGPFRHQALGCARPGRIARGDRAGRVGGGRDGNRGGCAPADGAGMFRHRDRCPARCRGNGGGGCGEGSGTDERTEEAPQHQAERDGEATNTEHGGRTGKRVCTSDAGHAATTDAWAVPGTVAVGAQQRGKTRAWCVRRGHGRSLVHCAGHVCS